MWYNSNMSNNFFIVSGTAILREHCSITGTSWTLVPSEGLVMTLKEACNFIITTPENFKYSIVEVENYGK